MTFTKLHASIVHSSIWQEADYVRVVWITMLALADEYGVVGASVGGLARAANVSREHCGLALQRLLSPDPDSRDGTTGERIEKVEGGWLVINHGVYRDRQTRAQALAAARVRRHREKRERASSESVTCNAGNVTERYEPLPSVLICSDLLKSPDRETSPTPQEGTEAPQTAKKSGKATVPKPDDVDDQVWADWTAHRKRKRASVSQTVLDRLRSEAEKAGVSLAEAMTVSVAQGWTGFQADWLRRGGGGGARRDAVVPRVITKGYYGGENGVVENW